MAAARRSSRGSGALIAYVAACDLAASCWHDFLGQRLGVGRRRKGIVLERSLRPGLLY